MEQKIKEGFDSIPIPERLSKRVEEALTYKKKKCMPLWTKITTSAAAAILLFFFFGVNISPVFAKAAYEIPLIGSVCRLFTIREYTFEDKTKYIEVSMPEIVIDGNTALSDRINLEIRKMVDEEIEHATANASEYYDAYIQTGGDPKEFIPLNVGINYELKCATDSIVSFVIFKYETQANYYQNNTYYNIDLETGYDLSLRDLFGKDYKTYVTKQVEDGMNALAEGQRFYLFDDVDLASLINDQRKFYLTDDGTSAVIVFEKYEIAAGAAGQLEFKVPIPE